MLVSGQRLLLGILQCILVFSDGDEFLFSSSSAGRIKNYKLSFVLVYLQFPRMAPFDDFFCD